MFAELRVPGAQRTLLFYAHYDGQPVDPKGWNQASPFTPVLRRRARSKTAGRRFRISWRCSDSRPRRGSTPARPRMTRRPSSRCSPPLDALASMNQRPTSNVKVILDGEEEARSPSLAATMGRYREKYRADLMLILDGPLHATASRR